MENFIFGAVCQSMRIRLIRINSVHHFGRLLKFSEKLQLENSYCKKIFITLKLFNLVFLLKFLNLSTKFIPKCFSSCAQNTATKTIGLKINRLIARNFRGKGKSQYREFHFAYKWKLTFSWWRSLSCRNQSIDFLCKKSQQLIVANQRKVQKLHFLIWISKEVVSETPNSFSL